MKYYRKLTLLFCLMWGFAGLQRVVISVIMPAIRADLGLTDDKVGYSAAITGLVWAFGTLLFAALMPAIAGILSVKFSPSAPMWMAALAGFVVAVVSMFYIETAPRVVEKMKVKPTQEDHLLFH